MATFTTERMRLEDGIELRLGHWVADDGGPRGTVLLLNGRSEHVDKYDETARDWSARGFAVWSLDWRGQGLSTRPGRHWQSGHVADFGDLTRDLDQVVRARVGPSLGDRPLVLCAHSMGGGIALYYLIEGLAAADRVRAVVLSAPMVAIAGLPAPRPIVEALARLMILIGRADAYAFGQGDMEPGKGGFEKNVLTSDRARYDRSVAHYHETPRLKVGGVTFGWLAAALRLERRLADRTALARITAPVLIGRAGREALVDNAALARIAHDLPNARLVDLPDALHELFLEADPIRNRFWAEIDGVLEEIGV